MFETTANMMKILWSLVKGFSPKEKWGAPDKIHPIMVFLMHRIREEFRSQCDKTATFTVHGGFAQEGHSRKSQHYHGRAVDFHINTSLSFAKQIEAMETILTSLGVFAFVGLGIYPTWNEKGFHLDIRGIKARWGRINGNYVPFADARAEAELTV